MALMRRLQSHGFEPSLYTYETIVWGFAKVREAAHQSVHRRGGRGWEPTRPRYSPLI